MRRIVLALMLSSLVLPATAQQAPSPALAQGSPTQAAPDMSGLISGNSYPLMLKLKDMDSNWRRITLGSSNDMGGYMSMVMAMMGGASGTPGAYYTRGQVVTSGTETYLVAYAPAAKKVDYAKLIRGGANSAPPPPDKLTGDTALTLSLLNLRTCGSLTDIRQFELNREIADSVTSTPGDETASVGVSEESAALIESGNVNAQSDNNLKQIGLAVAMYAQDYDDVLPPTKDAAKFQKVVMPYVKNSAVFKQPVANKPYRPNPALSGRKLGHIGDPAAMVMIYEAQPAADGTRGICFVDGHVKRISEKEWPRVAKASKIPAG